MPLPSAVDSALAMRGPTPRSESNCWASGSSSGPTITAPAAPGSAEILSELDVFVSCLLSGVPGWLTHEALALGLPSVISTASGAFALVQDGATGLLVERNHPAKVADAVQLLLRVNGSGARPGRFATDIDNRRTLGRHSLCLA